MDIRPFEDRDAEGIARLSTTVQWPSLTDADVVRQVCTAPGAVAYVAVSGTTPGDELVGWAQALGDGLRQVGADTCIDYHQGPVSELGNSYVFVRPDRETLDALARLVESEQLRVVVAERFTLDQLPDAHRRAEEGHGPGKVVVGI